MIFPRKTIKIGDCIAVAKKGCNATPWTKNKYKQINFLGEHWVAHRLSYSLNCEPIERKAQDKNRIWSREMVLHKCNNKWCINPDHLYLGMHQQNAFDFWNSLSPEKKEEFREKMKKVCSDEDYRAKMRIACKGIAKTEEHKRKIGIGRKGKLASDESKAKMSVSAKIRALRQPEKERKEKMKRIAAAKKNKIGVENA